MCVILHTHLYYTTFREKIHWTCMSCMAGFIVVVVGRDGVVWIPQYNDSFHIGVSSISPPFVCLDSEHTVISQAFPFKLSFNRAVAVNTASAMP